MCLRYALGKMKWRIPATQKMRAMRRMEILRFMVAPWRLPVVFVNEVEALDAVSEFFDEFDECLRREGLDDESCAGRGLGGFEECFVGKAAHENDFEIGLFGEEFVCDLRAVQAGHDDVGKEDVDLLLFLGPDFEGFVAVARLEGFEALAFQDGGGKLANMFVVIDHQYSRHGL
jgi:hypothetical protein